MKKFPRVKTLSAMLLALLCSTSPLGTNRAQAATTAPSWLSTSVIYCVFPEIFSSNGLSGVTAQLNRLHTLGVNVLWLMPFQPRGQAGNYAGKQRPSYNSPYDMSNLEGIASDMGTSSDLTALITNAHKLGMKVILDVALNQTSWDNPLINSETPYYLHSDSNVNNPDTIEEAFGSDADIAGINLTTDQYGAQDYMTGVCKYWLSNYSFDGFRVDSADNPGGSSRTLPQSYAQSLYSTLTAITPGILFLGEEDDASIADAPYNLDYGWAMQSTLESVTGGSSASALQTTYNNQVSGWPSGYPHMAITQDWDMDEDLDMYGGTAQTLDAAAFNYTIPGVPMMFNGEEVGNDDSGLNTHNQIDWNSPNASAFQSFYTALIALRTGNAALQKGSITWETNSSSGSVVTYDRLSGSNEVYTEINFSNSSLSGTNGRPSGAGGWKDVTPPGAPGGTSHVTPGTKTFSLAPYDYAVFKRTRTVTVAPTNLAATVSGSQVKLAWSAPYGASTYNVYRGTTAGGESATPVATGVTTASYTDGGLTGGIKYYYKVAAVDSVGVSPLSNEASAMPVASSGSLTGTLTPISSATTYNLTTLGTTDWAAWGYKGNNFDHKSSGNTQISNVAAVGGNLYSFQSSFLGFTWTDGTPDAGATGETYGYYNSGGSGDGFSFTAPASTTAQTLTVYVGGYNSEGTLTATLSDGSAAAYTSSALSTSITSGSYYGYYTLTYKALSANQTLTVKWLQNGAGTNITMYGAALH